MSITTRYTLPTDCPVRWTATQERSLSHDCPLPSPSESPSLKSVYSQFLWLPESVVPLTHLIPNIQRFFSQGSESAIMGLEELESLLLSPRQCSEKYHTRIPHILLTSQTALDGAGEEDESTMWYAFRNEKPLHDDSEGGEETMEDRWRIAWLERMEKREIQIQILLHFFLFQQPRSTPPAMTENSSPRKRKNNTQTQPIATLEDRLESLMDKLAMWQLLATVDAEQDRRNQRNLKRGGRIEDDRDWMQHFCEDIVKPAFSKALPDMYTLLHSKVFRHSLFSSSSDGEDGDPLRQAQTKRPTPQPGRATTTDSTRSRSRSLSISLEAERRANNTNTNGRKRWLSREVSMSKVFKKVRTQPTTTATIDKKPAVSEVEMGTSMKTRESRNILVQDTPLKGTSNRPQKYESRQRIERQGQLKMEVDNEEDGNVFAASTPMKDGGGKGSHLYKSYSVSEEDEGDDLDREEEWVIGSPSLRAMSRTLSSSDADDPGSPDVLLLG